MSEMQVKDFDEFSSPKRKPWLFLILVLVLVIIGIKILGTRSNPEPAVVEEPGPSVAAAPGGGEPAVSADTAEDPDAGSEAVPAPDIDIEATLVQARKLKQEGQLVDARRLYLALIEARIPARTRTQVEAELGELNLELVMTPRMTPEKVAYVVQSGDSVAKIAKKYGTTVELMQHSNRIANPNVIRAGDRFVVLNSPFAIYVSKKRNDLLITMGGRFFKRYSVGTGKFGKTPVGTFVITEKQAEPVWWKDGKAIPYSGDPKGENILGTRWMTLTAAGDTPPIKGYGIHGTWNESSIGKAESAGCVRMRNREVEELYILVPVGTSVTIED